MFMQGNSTEETQNTQPQGDIKAAQGEKCPKLKPREQEILTLLLEGKAPKEIGYILKISYGTVLFHQNKLYRKLGVHSIQELFAKAASDRQSSSQGEIVSLGSGVNADTRLVPQRYPLKMFFRSKFLVFSGIVFSVLILLFFLVVKPFNKGFPGVFYDWHLFDEGKVSTIELIVNENDIIKGKTFTSIAISGFLGYHSGDYAGVCAWPEITTLEKMKTMTSFSFKVLGDGNNYLAMIPTIETMADDMYHMSFSTTKDKITTVTIKVDELKQHGFGKQVPFNRDSIFLIQFQPATRGSFNLKVWDIRLH